MKSQNPYVSEAVEDGREDAGRPVVADPKAAERAMESGHHAFTGAATGVGSVDFEDPGAFGANAEPETPVKGPTEP